MTKIKISLIHFPVLTLGPGIRYGIWTQGCSIKCPGCMSKHTWNFEDGLNIEISVLIKKIIKSKTKNVTISGGEPFDQFENLLCLLKELKKIGIEDVLVYSGYSYHFIQKHFSLALTYIDVIITEPFINSQPTTSVWKGSENQKMFLLNKNLYQKYKLFKVRRKEELIQEVSFNGKVFHIGII